MRHVIVGLILVVHTSLMASAAIPVEGDAAKLRLLLDAQASNRARYATGEMTARVTEQGPVDQRFDVHFIWDGKRRYWHFSRGERNYESPEQRDRNEPFGEGYLIQRPDAKFEYNSDVGSATQFSRAVDIGRIPDALELSPDRRWYGFDRGTRSWDWMLDPDMVGEFVSKFVVRQDGADRIVVERHQSKGGVLQIEASLALGGNVVAYHAESRSQPTIYDGEYQWAADGRGGWYLKESRVKRANRQSPDNPDWSYHLQVLTFDPAPTIPRDRFEFSSLPLAPGTSVTVLDHSGDVSRRWVHGQSERDGGKVPENVLERLSNSLRAKGFANPERKK